MGEGIILVGNGTSLIGKGLGAKIDSHDVVVRFNNYQTSGYEVDVGRKVDWVARRSCSDVALHNAPRIFNFVTAFTPITPGMLEVSKQLKKFYGAKITNLVTECEEIHRLVGLAEGERCSVGILALCYFVEYMGVVPTVTNFDLVEGITDKPSHYFKKPPNDAKHHAWLKEAAKLKEYVEQGKATVLA